MESTTSDPPSGDDERADNTHRVLVKKHSHGNHNAMPQAANRHRRDDDGLVQTALDVIIDYQSTTVGTVLFESLPNEPTTLSLPGYGLLTLSNFAPARTTASSASTSITAMTSPSSTLMPTVTPFPTVTGTFNSSITSSIEVRTLMGGPANSTVAFLNSTSTTFSSTTLFSSTTTLYSSSSSLLLSTTAGPIVIPGGVGGNGPTMAPSATPSTIVSSQPSASNTSAGQIAGGVVGGVVGAMVVGLIMFLLARYFRNRQTRGDRLDDGEDGNERSVPPSRDGPMTQRSSLVPFAAVINRMRQSQQSSVYTADNPSERGFQRVSGRKLQPVTVSGGDGYTDPSPPSRPPALIAHNLSTEFLPRGEPSRRVSHTPTEFGGRDPGVRIPGEQFVTPETSAAAASAVQLHRPTVPPSSNSSLRAVQTSVHTGAAASGAAAAADTADTSAADAAALRSERMFHSGSPDSFDERLANRAAGESNAGDHSDSSSPDFTIQPGAQRTPIIARRPGDALGRSRPSQDGSRVSRFSETF